jgi:hypothetical protein
MKTPIYQLPSLSADSLPYLNMILTKLAHCINNIEFGSLSGTTTDDSKTENIWCTFVVVDSAGANVACSAAHVLKKKPLGTIAIWQDKAARLYKPTATISADTDTQVFYIFDTAAVSAVLLLI